MNNYSLLQQKLHQFALSSKFMREVMFDIESSAVSINQTDDNHVFVSGLARSGTTILLNAIHESNEFASLSYKDMPFILAPNLWSKLSFNKRNVDLVERAHGDGIKVSNESPEAFEEVFWMTFDESDKDTKEKFISVTTLLGKYKQPFDREGHSKRVADREGVSQELVLEMWEKEKVRACNRGTDIHKILEDYISFGDVKDNYGWLCKSYDKAAERSIDSFKNVLCENLL